MARFHLPNDPPRKDSDFDGPIWPVLVVLLVVCVIVVTLIFEGNPDGFWRMLDQSDSTISQSQTTTSFALTPARR